jgi:hypothetical protein
VSEQTATQLIAKIGTDQKLRYRVTPQPNSLLSAESLGGQLSVLSDLFAELGKKDGVPLKTFVSQIAMHEDGSIEFELAILPFCVEPAE